MFLLEIGFLPMNIVAASIMVYEAQRMGATKSVPCIRCASVHDNWSLQIFQNPNVLACMKLGRVQQIVLEFYSFTRI